MNYFSSYSLQTVQMQVNTQNLEKINQEKSVSQIHIAENVPGLNFEYKPIL